MVLVSFLYISRISEYENSLAITSHQFSLYLAIISHHPNGVMRICGLLAAKKVKKVRDMVADSIPMSPSLYSRPQ